MMNNTHTPHGPAAAREARAAVEHFDLTPAGLADAPAQQLDLDSLVHTGNSEEPAHGHAAVARRRHAGHRP